MMSRKSARRSEPATASDSDNSMSGWLMKKSEYHRGWKVRWCVLRGKEVTYFKSPESTKAIATIPLADAVVRESKDQSEERFAFEVVTRNRVFFFAAKTHSEMSEWIERMLRYTSLHKENALIEAAEDLACELALANADYQERCMRAYLTGRTPLHLAPLSDDPGGSAVPSSPPSTLHLSLSPPNGGSGGGAGAGGAGAGPRRGATMPHAGAERGQLDDRRARNSFPPPEGADERDAVAVAEFARSLSPAIFTAVGMPPSRGDL